MPYIKPPILFALLALAAILFRTAVELKEETGARITFINLSGGVGVPYRPEQPANDIASIGEGVRKAYEEILVPAGMGDVAICTELGRFMLAPYGHLVTRVLHQKHIHKEYIGADAFAAAKRDFATRSGLLSSGALFTPEQLAEVYRCIHETLDSPYTITDERKKCLRSAAEQIEDTVPDLAERVEMSNQAELLADMESPAGGTMQVY